MKDIVFPTFLRSYVPTFLLVFYALVLYGQDYETTREANFKDDITKVFQNVSVSSISSGFLTDIGMHFEEITDFSQQTLTDKNLTDIDIFGGVFASFVDCNINPSKQFPSSDAYFLAHKTYTPAIGNNQLAFILQDFHSLKKRCNRFKSAYHSEQSTF